MILLLLPFVTHSFIYKLLSVIYDIFFQKIKSVIRTQFIESKQALKTSILTKLSRNMKCFSGPIFNQSKHRSSEMHKDNNPHLTLGVWNQRRDSILKDAKQNQERIFEARNQNEHRCEYRHLSKNCQETIGNCKVWNSLSLLSKWLNMKDRNYDSVLSYLSIIHNWNFKSPC